MYVVSQFMQDLRKEHLSVAYWVLNYIKGSLECGSLIHAFTNPNLFGYCDLGRLSTYKMFPNWVLGDSWKLTHILEDQEMFLDYLQKLSIMPWS